MTETNSVASGGEPMKQLSPGSTAAERGEPADTAADAVKTGSHLGGATVRTVTSKRGHLGALRLALRRLYHGTDPQARRFRLAIIAVDILIIAFFIASPLIREQSHFLVIDYILAAVLALDLAARALAWPSFGSWVRRPIVWVDVLVLMSLLAPILFINFGFLRVLRLWTLVHSEFFWRTVARGKYNETRIEDLGRALASLVTFIFIATGFVYAGYAGKIASINNYVDALYFTIATVTTTGFGDITLPGNGGKLLSIVMMLSGITLLVNLAQALFRPHKVKYTCETCGLMRHDADAVHCKACGTTLNIPHGG